MENLSCRNNKYILCPCNIQAVICLVCRKVLFFFNLTLLKEERNFCLYILKSFVFAVNTKSNVDIIHVKHFWQNIKYTCVLIRDKINFSSIQILCSVYDFVSQAVILVGLMEYWCFTGSKRQMCNSETSFLFLLVLTDSELTYTEFHIKDPVYIFYIPLF